MILGIHGMTNDGLGWYITKTDGKDYYAKIPEPEKLNNIDKSEIDDVIDLISGLYHLNIKKQQEAGL